MRILLINGPNLNMLGRREQALYGSDTLDSVVKNLKNIADWFSGKYREWLEYIWLGILNAFVCILMGLLFCIFPVTYVMCAVRWYTTGHPYFWDGLKELIWALCPILNVTYVWDWWVNVFVYFIAFFD